MTKTLIAVPAPGGNGRWISAHFGHCDLFTLVEIDDGAVTRVDSLPSVAHQHGGCMVPVDLLADRGVRIRSPAGWGCDRSRASTRSASTSTRTAALRELARRFKRS